jgi:iron complex transport system substrate-binding protein
MAAPQRIVSLIPSATEIVAALGAGDRLVGRSHECDYPPEVTRLPVLTAPRAPLTGSAAGIDRAVRALLENALAVYRLDTALLRELAPDLIVTQAQCDVCAVSLGDVQAAARDWLDHEVAIVSLEPKGLGAVWADVETVGAALNEPETGRTLAADLQARAAAIAARAGDAADGHPSVACIEWVEPLMTGGHWMPELVELAGGRPVLGAPGGPAPRIDWADLVAADPDIIVVMPCGFGLERTRADLPVLAAQPGWADLEAVRTGRVYLADGNQYFNRPGPRLLDSLEILGEIIHPHLFPPRHRGTGWELAGSR